MAEKGRWDLPRKLSHYHRRLFPNRFTMILIPRPVSTQIVQSPLAPSALAIVPIEHDSNAPHGVPDSRPFVEQLNRYLALPAARTNDMSLNSKESFKQMLRDLFPDPR